MSGERKYDLDERLSARRTAERLLIRSPDCAEEMDSLRKLCEMSRARRSLIPKRREKMSKKKYNLSGFFSPASVRQKKIPMNKEYSQGPGHQHVALGRWALDVER